MTKFSPISRLSVSAAALVLAPFLAMQAMAAPQAPGVPDVASDEFDPSVIVFDQKAGDKEVRFSFIRLPHDGYVAIYGSDDEGRVTGDVLGYVPLEAGYHHNVTVGLDQELESGSTMWASLYRDDDGDKKLDKSEDSPFWPNGKPLENRFDVL